MDADGFACLEVFTQPCTNIWLWWMWVQVVVLIHFFQTGFDFQREKPIYVMLLASGRCEADPPAQCGIMSYLLQRRDDLESTLMWELFSSPQLKMMNKSFLLLLNRCDFFPPFIYFFFMTTFFQPPHQPGQPGFKFTVAESCDRIKDEFQFLQAQYHR